MSVDERVQRPEAEREVFDAVVIYESLRSVAMTAFTLLAIRVESMDKQSQ